jgi:hypothetical protein
MLAGLANAFRFKFAPLEDQTAGALLETIYMELPEIITRNHYV